MRGRSRIRALGAALAVALLALACSPGAQVYDATGAVQAVDLKEAQLTVQHEDIPGFMPAMTMNFDVAEAVPLGELRPGDRIRFRLERSGSALRITSVEVIGKGEPPEGSGGVAAASAELQPAPAFELIDQDGRRFSLGELHGSAVLLDFIFTRCAGPCPLLTARQVELQRALDPALRACTRFVSISVDPEYDQPDVLRAYARAHGADLRDWWFLTGETPAVDAALAAYGVGASRTDARNLEHTVATYLIDPQGRIAHRYLGLGADRAELERDLRAACGG